jgi:hypothetical protein
VQTKVKTPLKILDMDIETRPSGFHFGGPGKPIGSEPIIIAAGWAGSDEIHTWSLGPLPAMSKNPESILEQRKIDGLHMFRELYDQADMVTGHYIRKFDLPILNAHMLRNGLPMLDEKLACDTKLDLRDIAAHSQSQENLSALLGCARSKHHMNDEDWRAAGNLYPDPTVNCLVRCHDDVLQHNELRTKLLESGALKAPKLWKP